jgi:hypothetical protein
MRSPRILIEALLGGFSVQNLVKYIVAANSGEYDATFGEFGISSNFKMQGTNCRILNGKPD